MPSDQNTPGMIDYRTTALLACPFCGQTPRLKAGKVKCVNNQCKVQPKTAAWYAKGYEQNAVNDWNERQAG